MLASRMRVAFCLLLIVVAPAFAQPYPAKPIRLVVPFPVGGTADLLAHDIAQRLTVAWGADVVVDNRPGANGKLGAELAAKSPPDGYTLLLGTLGALSTEPGSFARPPYGAVKGYAPIILLCKQPNVLLVNPALPFNSLRDVIVYAKAHPGKLSLGFAGSSNSAQLAAGLFQQMAGVTLLQRPFMGQLTVAPRSASAKIQLRFEDLSSSLPLINAGKLKALAVTSTTRALQLPEVPTMAEAGLPGFEATSWFGVLAPAGTPAAIVDRLNAEIAAWLVSPDAQGQLANRGLIVAGGAPADFAQTIAAQTAKSAEIAGIPDSKAYGAKRN